MFSLPNRQVHGLNTNNNNNNKPHHRPSLVERIKENVRNNNYTSINNGISNVNNKDSNHTAMKWSSSSSSSLSSTGDRKSVFYTDPDMAVPNDKMADIEAAELRIKLQNTEESLDVQVRKCENLILFFTTQIQCLTDELETEKSWRTSHLTKIVKALMCFEAKLKNDQKLVRRQLYEKDGEINRLYQQIVVLRERYGDTSNIDIDVCKIAQYCPACRKEYHLLESQNVAVQVYTNNNNSSTNNNTDTSPTQSVGYLSSSEEGITPSFLEARRSKKYMSKRTSGTFRDYLRSRSSETQIQSPECGVTTFCGGNHNHNSNNYNNNNINSITATSNNKSIEDADDDMNNTSDHMNNNNYKKYHNDDTNCIDNKEDIRITAEKNKKNKEHFKRNSNRGSYSSYINNMHGLKPQNVISAADQQQHHHHHTDDYNARSSNEDAADGDDDVHAVDDEDGNNVFKSSNSSFLKKYNTEAVTKSQFESTDDWYASASDMDDSDSAISKPYGYNAVNPVLECVNQILLQQSMDCMLESSTIPEEDETTPVKEPSVQRNPKRVHFSTQNSMVQVPRTDCPIEQMDHQHIDEKHHLSNRESFSYESVYSNEYEPIGSENTCTTNHYVDMESKIGQEDRPLIIEKPKIPPALPPKPANLMKLRQVLKISNSKSQIVAPPTKRLLDSCDNESEPDYCSISEVNDSAKHVQIVADVHKNADEMSSVSDDAKTDVTDESFADIPKLPNVAAIISPKKEVIHQFIAQDNYITKSPAKSVQSRQVPNILAEINRKNKPQQLTSIRKLKMSTINETKSVPSPTKISQQLSIASPDSISSIPLSEDKMPLQAEFDWYNLDAEYGKAHKVNPEDNNMLDPMDDRQDNHIIDSNDISVEYNLDEEFILTNNQSNENDCGVSEHVHHMQEQRTITQPVKKVNGNFNFESFHVETPRKTFESFLNDTGLTTKPLPRKRKIFYSAPFV